MILLINTYYSLILLLLSFLTCIARIRYISLFKDCKKNGWILVCFIFNVHNRNPTPISCNSTWSCATQSPSSNLACLYIMDSELFNENLWSSESSNFITKIGHASLGQNGWGRSQIQSQLCLSTSQIQSQLRPSKSRVWNQLCSKKCKIWNQHQSHIGASYAQTKVRFRAKYKMRSC